MAKKIRIIPWLDEKEFNKQLSNILNKKHKVKVDVDANGINNTTKSVRQLSKVTNESTSFFGKLKTAISNTFSSGRMAMTSYLLVLNEINKAGKQAKKTIVDMDQAVTDLSVAMNSNRAASAEYLKTLNKQAIELKSTTKSVSDAADSWLRQGKSVGETETLIKDALVLSKVGKIDAASATDYLTSALNGYKLEAKDAISVIDRLTAIDAESASESGGLALSMSRTASAADMAGVSMNKLLGWLATVKETSRATDETVGNMMKTMLSRMNQVKVGNFLDAETGESLNDMEKTLTKVGIAMRDANGQFISSEIVIDELGKRFNEFDSVTKRAVATQLGGAYQYEKVIALLSNYSKALKYAEIAENSAGTAMQKFENSYIDSLEAKQNALQASFEAMIINSDFDEVYSGIIKATTALVDFVNQTNALKGIFTGLTTVGLINMFTSLRTGINQAYVSLNQFQNALYIVKSTDFINNDFDILLKLSKNLSSSQTKLLLSTKTLTVAQREQILVNQGLSAEEAKLKLETWGLATAETGLSASTTSLSNAFKGLWSTLLANPLILIATAVSAGVMVWQSYQQSQEEARQATQDAANTAKEETISISELLNKYNQLSEEVKTNASVKDSLISTQDELLKSLGIEKSELDDLISKYGSLNRAINQVTLDALKDNHADLLTGYNSQKEELLNTGKGYEHWYSFTDRNLISGGADSVKAFDVLEKAGIESRDSYGPEGGSLVLAGDDKTVEGILENYQKLKAAQDALHESVKNGIFTEEELSENSLYNAIAKREKELRSYVDNYNSAIDSVNKSSAKQQIISDLMGKELPKTEKEFETLKQSLIEAAQESNNFIGSQEDIKDSIINALAEMPEFSKYFENISAFGDSGAYALQTFAEMFSSLPTDKLEEYMALFKAGVIDEKTISSYSELSDAMSQTGTSAEDAIKSIKDFSEGFTSSIDLTQGIQDSYDLLQDLNKELDEYGQIGINSLGKIAKQFPELSLATAEYSQGLLTTNDLMAMLEQAYADDADAYRTAMANKLGNNEEFFSTIAEKNTDLFKELSDDYGIDIRNYSDLAKAKLKIDNELINKLATKWAGYYGVIKNSIVHADDGTVGLIEDDARVIHNPAYREVEDLLAEYNAPIKALNDIIKETEASIEIPDFGGIGEDRDKSSSKSSKENSDIDWIDRRIQLINKKNEELESALSDTYTAYTGLTKDEIDRVNELFSKDLSPASTEVDELIDLANKAGMSIGELQNAIQNGTGLESRQSILSELISNDKIIIGEYQNSVEQYKKSYEDLVAKVPEYRDKIENGGDRIELVSGTQNTQIKNAIDAYDKWQEAESNVDNATKELRDHNKEYYTNISDSIEAQNTKLKDSNDLIEKQIDYLTARGSIVSSSMYESLIDNTVEEIANERELLANKQAEMADMLADGTSKDSEEYVKLASEISQAKSNIIDLEKAQEEYNKRLLELPIDNLDTIIGMYNDITTAIQNWGAELEASGKKLDAGYYQSLIANGATVIDNLKEQADAVQEVMREYDKGSDRWKELYSKLQSINGEMSSMVKNLYAWNEALLKMPMDSINEFSSALQKAVAGMEKVFSDYDIVISAVTTAIQDQIDLLKEQNDQTNETYQNKIDALQEQLDLLDKANERRKLQLALEQALYELDKARNQKTVRTIREGEITYEKDSDAERNAQNAAADAEYNLKRYDLQEQLKGYQDELDKINDSYNDQIEKLEKISEKWSEIKENIEKVNNEALANEYLGAGWKDKVLSGNDTDLYNMFKSMYETLDSQKTQYEEQIESTDNIYALLEDYIASYKEGTITYDQAMSGINDLLSQMNQKMSSVDNLQNIFDYLGTANGTAANADAILSGIQNALTGTADELLKSMEQYNKNSGMISEYTTSWQQLTNNVEDMKGILEDVRDALENASDRDDDDDEDSKSHIVGHGSKDTSGYVNSGPGVPKYKDGIENGAIGKINSDRIAMLKYLSTHALKQGEVPVIAHKGEAILNSSQQEMLLRNLTKAVNPQQYIMPNLVVPDYSKFVPEKMSQNMPQNVEINIGDVEVQGVKNAEEFINSMATLADQALRIEFGKTW